MTEKVQEIIQLIEIGKMEVDTALEAVANDGLCPCLLNDDFGNWALALDGYQSVPENPGEPSDIETSFWVAKDFWKKTIKEAIIYSLTESIKQP